MNLNKEKESKKKIKIFAKCNKNRGERLCARETVVSRRRQRCCYYLGVVVTLHECRR